MKKSLLIALLLTLAAGLRAEPPTSYMELTNHELTIFNEYIWLDSLRGRTRSNDYIFLKSIHTSGPVISAQRISIRDRDPNEPLPDRFIENAPLYHFPRRYDHIRAMANPWISSRDGRYMTRLKARGGQGIEVHQYILGTPAQDSLVAMIPPGNGTVVLVDGQVELEGVIVGMVTIYSTGDMWLIDNIRYDGSNPLNGRYDWNEMQHMLALVSESNIIIANTPANGRENGWANGSQQNNIARHSIVINGSLIALGESFTFQNQNDDWEQYQGPTPDERGIIHLTGSVMQYRRGYLHRSNHGTGNRDGTGYGKDFVWDFRLDGDAPPGFRPGEFPDVSGNYDELGLFLGPHHIRNTVVGRLTVWKGTELLLEGLNALTIRESLEVLGAGDEPVVFNTHPIHSRAGINMRAGRGSWARVDWTQFAEGILLNLEADTIRIRNSTIGGEASFTGNVTLDSCTFAAPLHVTGWDWFNLSRNEILDGLTVLGNVREGCIINNTFTGARDVGLMLMGFRELDVRNNILAFNGAGIVNRSYNQPVMEYNLAWRNLDGDYLNCQPGAGSIIGDPRFIDQRRNNLHIGWNSPAFNAGDPASPRDPDGSRADIGAHYVDVLDVELVRQTFLSVNPASLSVHPNPFNSTSVASYELRVASSITLELYDTQGRLMRVLDEGWRGAARHRVLIDPSGLAAGVYVAVLQVGESRIHSAKLIYMP